MHRWFRVLGTWRDAIAATPVGGDMNKFEGAIWVGVLARLGFGPCGCVLQGLVEEVGVEPNTSNLIVSNLKKKVTLQDP